MGTRGRPRIHDRLEKLAFSRQRAQARFKGEPWQLTFEEWWELWQPHWHLRGNAPTSMNMIRRDTEKGWYWDNVQVTVRSEYLHRRKRIG